jgi:hypothetical protein
MAPEANRSITALLYRERFGLNSFFALVQKMLSISEWVLGNVALPLSLLENLSQQGQVSIHTPITYGNDAEGVFESPDYL